VPDRQLDDGQFLARDSLFETITPDAFGFVAGRAAYKAWGVLRAKDAPAPPACVFPS
jgi:hypothetical protein